MKRELLSKAVGDIDARYIAEACRPVRGDAAGSPERTEHMRAKRIIPFALAAVLLLALGVSAYALWNTHAARQRELREDLRIDENHAESYVEYPLSETSKEGLTLLSAVNDGEEQRVYVNISPVSEEEAAEFPKKASFFWTIPGTDAGGFAAPQLPAELSLSGADAIREAVLAHAYDAESRTLTLQCWLGVDQVKSAMEALGTESVPLQLNMYREEEPYRSFGPLSFTLTEEQRRSFDFGPALYYDAELDKEIEIVGLELTPFSAVWKVRYEGAGEFHQPDADWNAYRDWSGLEDRVCMESELVFPDGTRFSTGGVLTAPFENGLVNLHCGWGAAIDVDAVQRIVLGDLVLWEAK